MRPTPEGDGLEPIYVGSLSREAVTLRPSEPFLLPRPGSSESGSTLARLVETNLCNQHGVTVTVCVYTSTMNHTTVTGYCQASCVTT